MQTIESESKEQKSGFLGTPLGTLCATLSGYLISVYSIKHLPKMKEGANLINLDEYKSIETL